MKQITLISLFLITSLLLSEKVFAQDESATDSVDLIQEEVQEKIEQVKNKPKAQMGIVTDIAERTFQLESLSDEIEQVSYSEENTGFINMVNKKEVVSHSDVAIGDFIIAMGTANGSGVIEAKRILITKKLTPTNRKSILGAVVGIEGKEVTIKSQDKTLKLSFPKRWKGPEIAELGVGMKIIAIGELVNSSLDLRTIQSVSE